MRARGIFALIVGLSVVGGWVAGPAGANRAVKSKAVAAAPSAGCEVTPPVAAGQEKVTISSGGQDRWFFRHVPPSYNGTTPMPVIVDIHGYLEGAQIHTLFTRLGEYGDQQGFITIIPQGQGTTVPFWIPTLDSPDVTFIGDLLDNVESTMCVDTNRVFVTGMSNGAMMASVLACVDADRIAAVAPVAGVTNLDKCKPSRPVPVMAIHGTDDQVLSYEGGLGPVALGLPSPDGNGTLGGSGAADVVTGDASKKPLSMEKTAAAWAKRNRCAMKPKTTKVADDVNLIAYKCPKNATVELFSVVGGGHSWPGSEVAKFAEAAIGHTTFSINANEEVWKFFQAHPLKKK